MAAPVGQLESLTGHRFSNIDLLVRATTHRSWAYENNPDAAESEIHQIENESIEFIGDSVLGLVVAENLYNKNKGASEGDLTLMKHRLVSTASLASVAERLELGKFIRIGKGEEHTGGRKKQTLLANTLEAIIGAIFLDGGYSAAKVFITRIFTDEFREISPKSSLDFKTLLQETLQAEKLAAPRYNVLRTEGPPHDREFFVEAIWEGGRSTGNGRSIKSAEMMAAQSALEAIKATSLGVET
ncbi:MAG: ribonuclease III [Blastocatellia bacterium]|jgi:ribonuclease-3|nr:ribonuclease III [Blastocatellia bacterium]